ncbi:MAG: nucleotide pyrophosphohydrolase [Candidatus Eremiobacteraeota bacterium]|nr:nucleotide pyrophosphohydrolase [Candidatus Eremiobacteraeota bacterium]
MDKSTTLGFLKEKVGAFIDEREWRPYHDAKNLSMSIAIEAAELMELFQWATSEESRRISLQGTVIEKAADEMADIMIYLLSLSRALKIDLSEAVLAKLSKNEKRFPPGTDL